MCTRGSLLSFNLYIVRCTCKCLGRDGAYLWILNVYRLPLPNGRMTFLKWPSEFLFRQKVKKTKRSVCAGGGGGSGGTWRGHRGVHPRAGYSLFVGRYQLRNYSPHFLDKGQLLDLQCPNLQPPLFIEAQGQPLEIYNY